MSTTPAAAGVVDRRAAGTRLLLTEVSRAFPGVQALDRVSLDVAAGEIHGLVGENGAGKSTLMAIASGALAADHGHVRVDGVALEQSGDPSQARRLGVAIVRQHPQLMPDLTVAENLVAGLDEVHRPRSLRELEAWAGDRLRDWREDCGLAPGDRVDTLAPDQRFVVEIARALAQRPAVLILDEPTEHLLPTDVDVLFARVRALAAQGTAIVYISHRLREVQRLVDRLTVLRDGTSCGTYGAGDLTEDEIVELIAGRPIAAAFPARHSAVGTEAVLELEGFGGPGFAPLDVTVRRGEILGLAGIEGNGQRELLRALAGLAPATGEIVLEGRRLAARRARPAARPGIAYVPNDRHREGILADASVRENLSLRRLDMVARHGLLRPRVERRRAAAAVADFDIKTPTVDTPIGSLSGGNQQKAVLAGALATEPRLLLADEPTQGVDVGARTEIYRVLRDYLEDGHAIVLLASDALELEGLCDRVLVFSRGQVTATLDGDAVTERNIASALLTTTTAARAGDAAQRGGRGHRLRSWLAGDGAPPLIVALAVLLLGLYAMSANDLFLTERNLVGILALTATLALAAIGQQLAMLVGGIDLSVGPLMGLLVVIESFFLTEGAGARRAAVGWVLLVVVAVAVGALNWSLVDLGKLHPMVATLVTYMGLQGISLLLRPTPDGLISSDLIATITTGWGIVPAAFVVAVVVAVGLQLALTRTRVGIELRAVGSNAEAARVSGISPPVRRLIAYVGCSLLAAAASVLLMAQVGSGDPSAGLDYTLTSVAAAVIGGASIFGGRGSFIGCLLGALLLQEVTSVTTFLQLDAAWQSYLQGGMILLAVAAYSIARRSVEHAR
ncbi:ATP-binding cassette domain-containing protein [Baekduia alba]|uniref:ATP-binding cassette domain-containing protein n=1 Tax=Baekduia alba TaxID=2997333 RepID=UPI00234265A3|nr:ATP-binding cassette domain-containing protein [Baekduia alba]